MKKTLSALFVITGLHVFACGGYIDLPKWSVGVIGMGNYGSVLTNWHPYFLPGIQINRKLGLYELRFGVEHTKFYTEPNLEQTGDDILYISGGEKMTTFRVGMERSWNLSKWFEPYGAIDLAARKSYSDLTYVGGIMGMDEEDEITTKGIGLMPTVGFKTNFGKHVAFFAEYRAEAFMNSVQEKKTYYLGNVDSRPAHETTGSFNAGSIGNVGFQFTF